MIMDEKIPGAIMHLEAGAGADRDCVDGVDVQEEPVLNSPYQVADAPDLAATSTLGQLDAEATSTYGKRKLLYTLPVTFFDVQSNLSFLRECCPLSINIVDCNKYPWYYKKYMRTDLQTQSSGAIDLTNNKDCCIIDLNKKMYDKFEKASYKPKQRRIGPRSSNKKIKKSNNQQDRLKLKALSQVDLSNIDFKRNKGLIGLKISHRIEVMVKSNDDFQINDISDTENSQESVKSKFNDKAQNNDVDKYISVVDKALCSLGTTIIPITRNRDALPSTRVSSDTKVNTMEPLKKSETIIQISKNKLSNKTNLKYIPNENTKNDISEIPLPLFVKMGAESLNNETSSAVVSTTQKKRKRNKNKKKHRIRPVTWNKVAEGAIQEGKEVKDTYLQINKAEDNPVPIQIEERKETNDNVDNKSRSKSPIFSINNNMNKPLNLKCINCPVFESKQEQPAKGNLTNKNLNKYALMMKSGIKEDFTNKLIISLPQNECDPLLKKGIKTDKSDKHCNKNLPKLQYERQYKPSLCLQSPKVNIDQTYIDKNRNKNVITIIATDENKTHNNTNFNSSVCNVEPLTSKTSVGTLSNHPQVLAQNVQEIVHQKSNIQDISPIKVVDNVNSLKQQVRHNKPQQSQIILKANYRRGDSANIPSLFSSNGHRLPLPRPPAPQPDHASYNRKSINISRHIAPYAYQNNFHENMSSLRNVPPPNSGNPNMYWPCYSQHAPPPPIPPPPPPPPPENPVEKPNVTVAQNVITKNVILARSLPNKPSQNVDHRSNSERTNTLERCIDTIANSQKKKPDETIKNYEQLKDGLSLDKSVSNVKIVDSKPEMFAELQKETLKLDNKKFHNDKVNKIQNRPKRPYHQVNMPIFNKTVISSQVWYPNANSSPISHIVKSSVSARDSKVLHPELPPQQSKYSHKDASVDWKIGHEEVNKSPNNHSNSFRRTNDAVNDNKKGSPQAHKTPTNRPKVGPLCMKNRTGPFAKHQSPRTYESDKTLSVDKSQLCKGYSPPILPIPTFQKSLEMLTRANDTRKHLCTDRISTDVCIKPQSQPTETPVKINTAEKRARDKMSYFFVDNKEKSLKQITLQDYQNRVANGDGEYIVVKKNSSGKRAKCNETSEQDLGYDSDATVKL